MSDAKTWLRENRCPHCVNRDKRKCAGRWAGEPYTVKRSHEGWRCCGYRSRHWDERMWA